MAKYIVEHIKTNSYEKNYKFPLVNIVPAVVWSIPLHQKLFPDANWWVTFGICAAFVILYCALSYMPIIGCYRGVLWIYRIGGICKCNDTLVG